MFRAVDAISYNSFAAAEPVAKTGGRRSPSPAAADSSPAPSRDSLSGLGATTLHAAEHEPERRADDTGFAPGALI